MLKPIHLVFVCLAGSFAGLSETAAAASDRGEAQRQNRQAVMEHWTPRRRAAATPRDLVIDESGRGYLRKRGGVLVPYGQAMAPTKKPDGAGGGNGGGKGGGGSDGGGDSGGGLNDGPVISAMDPAIGAVIGQSKEFAATVSDTDGVKSVQFTVQKLPSGQPQSFRVSEIDAENDRWGVSLSGFSGGNWQWWVTAKDAGPKGGTETISDPVQFSVSGAVINDPWTSGGTVKTAAGRIYFEMPADTDRITWDGYVCSGTVVLDGTSGRSVILTAAHCVYDDANKAFARKVLFIPDQDSTTGNGTDLDCSNDPLGCWVPDFGVVDQDWTTRVFPDNIPWDYAFYVVEDADSSFMAGYSSTADAGTLDNDAPGMSISFSAPSYDLSTSEDFSHALGYSYSNDPNFMYCAESMTTIDIANWWLPSCDLSGGSSGGPWVQPMDDASGNGPIISVNSWGYTTSPGMAGPMLNGSSASCLFSAAKLNGFTASETIDGDAGYAVSCP